MTSQTFIFTSLKFSLTSAPSLPKEDKQCLAADKTIFKKAVFSDFKEEAVPFGPLSLSSSFNSFNKVTNHSATTQMFPEQQTVRFYI